MRMFPSPFEIGTIGAAHSLLVTFSIIPLASNQFNSSTVSLIANGIDLGLNKIGLTFGFTFKLALK